MDLMKLFAEIGTILSIYALGLLAYDGFHMEVNDIKISYFNKKMTSATAYFG